jgi:hypothetical protein
MANMSYCRFQNTFQALRDCYNALNDGQADDKDISEDEKIARDQLISLCADVVQDYGDL